MELTPLINAVTLSLNDDFIRVLIFPKYFTPYIHYTFNRKVLRVHLNEGVFAVFLPSKCTQIYEIYLWNDYLQIQIRNVYEAQ